MKIWSGFLFIFAIITGICRIGTTVHWTTDILAGMIVGLLVPLILIHPLPYRFLKKWVILPIIKVECWILEKVFGWREEAPIKRGAQTKKTDKN
ncbi:MAG: phosphatase PAP2 family protein [bacterium]|nr:phosphatase PAP2 family protein [bacterium]